MEFEDIKNIDLHLNSPEPLKFESSDINYFCKEETNFKREVADVPVSDSFLSLNDYDFKNCHCNIVSGKCKPCQSKLTCEVSEPEEVVIKSQIKDENEVEIYDQSPFHDSSFTYGGSVESFLGKNSHIFDKIREYSQGLDPDRRRSCSNQEAKCEYCERVYRSKGDLKRHIGSFHLNLKGFRCEVCNVSFSRKSSQKKHYNKFHLKNKTFRCRICSYQGGSKYHLRRHLNAVHESINVHNYCCGYCDFTTKYKVSIKKHLDNKHLPLFTSRFEEPLGLYSRRKKSPNKVKRKQVQCPHCEYHARDRTRLEGHINSRHEKIKPYACKFCPYNSSHMEQLKAHTINKHKLKYKCQLCTLTFKSKSLLKYHKLNVHFSTLLIELEQYICYYCYQSYHCKDNLVRHIKLLHRSKFLK